MTCHFDYIVGSCWFDVFLFDDYRNEMNKGRRHQASDCYHLFLSMPAWLRRLFCEIVAILRSYWREKNHLRSKCMVPENEKNLWCWNSHSLYICWIMLMFWMILVVFDQTNYHTLRNCITSTLEVFGHQHFIHFGWWVSHVFFANWGFHHHPKDTTHCLCPVYFEICISQISFMTQDCEVDWSLLNYLPYLPKWFSET